MKIDIIVVGVGGQGILTASNVIGAAAIEENFKLRGSETHGMAQRGGSVISHIRIGDVHSPLIPKGECDFLLGFEPLEALRSVDFVNEKSISILNTTPIIPMQNESIEYPSLDNIINSLGKYSKIIHFDALKLAKKAGHPMTMSMVMVGVLSSLENFPIKGKTLINAIKNSVPEKTIEMNIKAFELGKSSHTLC